MGQLLLNAAVRGHYLGGYDVLEQYITSNNGDNQPGVGQGASVRKDAMASRAR
jgi:hypothetical protein